MNRAGRLQASATATGVRRQVISISDSGGERMRIPLYDPFSSDYDRFVNWERRLAQELPFIEAQLTRANARRVLDVACGTGRHALALAERGYEVTGVDPSTGMIEQARLETSRQQAAVDARPGGRTPRFEVAGFGELAAHASTIGGDFDALLCLGSSLPHVLDQADLAATLADFAAVLRPGGLLLIQNRNFDRVLARATGCWPGRPGAGPGD